MMYVSGNHSYLLRGRKVKLFHMGSENRKYGILLERNVNVVTSKMISRLKSVKVRKIKALNKIVTSVYNKK